MSVAAALIAYIPYNKEVCPKCGASLEKNTLDDIRCSKSEDGCDFEAVYDHDSGRMISLKESRKIAEKRGEVSTARLIFQPRRQVYFPV